MVEGTQSGTPARVTIYWRKDSSIASDGTLGMPVSGRDAEGCLWSDAITLRPGEKNYELWRWIIGQGDRYKAILSDKDLESIRQEYHRSAEGAARPARGHCHSAAPAPWPGT